MSKGARGLVHPSSGMDTYRRWGIAPRPENFAASGSARQYRKETGELIPESVGSGNSQQSQSGIVRPGSKVQGPGIAAGAMKPLARCHREHRSQA